MLRIQYNSVLTSYLTTHPRFHWGTSTVLPPWTRPRVSAKHSNIHPSTITRFGHQTARAFIACQSHWEGGTTPASHSSAGGANAAALRQQSVREQVQENKRKCALPWALEHHLIYFWILLNCLYSFLVNRLEEFCFSSQINCCVWSSTLFLLPSNFFCVDNVRRIYILINWLGPRELNLQGCMLLIGLQVQACKFYWQQQEKVKRKNLSLKEIQHPVKASIKAIFAI